MYDNHTPGHSTRVVYGTHSGSPSTAPTTLSYPWPASAPPAPPKRTALAVAGFVFALSGLVALALALDSYHSLLELSEEGSAHEWVRAMGFNDHLREMRLFAIAAAGAAFLASPFAIVGRRATVGKAALALTVALVLGSSATAAGSFAYSIMDEAAAERRQAASPREELERAMRSVVSEEHEGSKDAAFLLGSNLALAVLGRAHGLDWTLSERSLSRASMLARELEVELPRPPIASGNQISDEEEAIAYLLHEEGTLMVREIGRKHDVAHGVLFVLGVALEVRRIAGGDLERARDANDAILRLAPKANVADAVAALDGNVEDDHALMGMTIDAIRRRILMAIR